MSDSDHYNSKMPLIMSIPEGSIRRPNHVPVDVFVQEAEELCHWCRKDRDELVLAGFDWFLVDDIPARCGVLREAEARWITVRFGKTEAEEIWLSRSQEGKIFRDEMKHTFSFAYRNEPDIKKSLKVIFSGNSSARIIQQLNDISVLGKNAPQPLSKIGFDPALLEKSASLSDEMAELLARKEAARSELNRHLDIRNRAYSYLKDAVDELRAFGQFVFRQDRQRLRGYASEHIRQKNRKHPSDMEKEDADVM